MKASNRMVNIIEDHACICHFIDCLCTSIENGTELPNFVPVLNDALVTDQLGKIAEVIQRSRMAYYANIKED